MSFFRPQFPVYMRTISELVVLHRELHPLENYLENLADHLLQHF